MSDPSDAVDCKSALETKRPVTFEKRPREVSGPPAKEFPEGQRQNRAVQTNMVLLFENEGEQMFL